MRKAITINIPKPCHENWESMTPTDKGRHCAACKKNVFDFTSKTDEYIVKTFLENNNVCGRFKPTQLNKELVLSRKEKNNYLSFAASGLFAFLGISSLETHAQGKPKIEQVNTILIGKVNPVESNQSSSINHIYGTITDESKLPLPGANIVIKGTSKGTISDFDGNFTIEAKPDDILQISYLGYESREVKISNDVSKIILTELKEDITGGFVVIAGYAEATYEPKHVCTPEELERKRQNKLRRKNYFTFYQRQQKEHRDKIKNGDLERTKIGKVLYKLTNVFRKNQ